MPKGIYDRTGKKESKAPLKERVVCKKCFNVFYPDTSIKRNKVACPFCGRKIDIRDRRMEYKEYCNKYPEKAKKRKDGMIAWEKEHKAERAKKQREIRKKVIFNIISNGNPVCNNCGCNDIRLLEINHKNGGGGKEMQKGKRTNAFRSDIYSGRRKTDDLELLCRVCNAKYYLEMKYGKIPMVITWTI